MNEWLESEGRSGWVGGLCLGRGFASSLLSEYRSQCPNRAKAPEKRKQTPKVQRSRQFFLYKITRFI